MGFFELLFLAVALSMDAFAVSVCKGLTMDRITIKQVCIVGAWFGGFQALMPAIGYFLGSSFERYITAYDHWVAFLLLAVIGGSMIKEALDKTEGNINCSIKFGAMLYLAVATSIDALAVGITFAFLIAGIRDLIFAVLMIGASAFVLSGVGLRVGFIFGCKYKSKAEFVGGGILILLGIKILLEHLGIIGF